MNNTMVIGLQKMQCPILKERMVLNNTKTMTMTHTTFLKDSIFWVCFSSRETKSQSRISPYHSHSHSGYSSRPLIDFLPTFCAQAAELCE